MDIVTQTSPSLPFSSLIKRKNKCALLLLSLDEGRNERQTGKAFFFPLQSRVLAQRDLATALSTFPVVRQPDELPDGRSETLARSLIAGQPDTTRSCLSSLAVGLVASRLIRFILIHERETARERERDTHNASVLSWVFQLFRRLLQHLCSLILQLLMPRKMSFVRHCFKRHQNNPRC